MKFIRPLIAAFVLASGACGAQAQNTKAQDTWPDRPIRFIVTSAAGGGIDLMARILADGLSRQLPKAVVVENNGAAGGLIATRAVASAGSDGYTFLFQGPGYAALPYIHRNPGFDVRKDFAPVSLVAKFPLVLITRPSLNVKTLRDFIALVKANPGKYTFGSSGLGGASHIPLEAIKDQAGLDMIHVPYRGSGQTTAALLAGQIELTIDGMAPQIGNMQSGTVIPLGVSTEGRAPQMPEIPAIDEVLPGFKYPMWVAVFASAETPAPIVEKMSKAIADALKEPAVRKRYEDLLVEVVGSTPAALGAFADEQLRFNKAIIDKAKIQAGE